MSTSLKIEVIPENRPETRVEAPSGDFLTEDINVLMNDDITPSRAPTDHDKMYADYDRELMSFRPVRKRRTWPQPITR